MKIKTVKNILFEKTTVNVNQSTTSLEISLKRNLKFTRATSKN